MIFFACPINQGLELAETSTPMTRLIVDPALLGIVLGVLGLVALAWIVVKNLRNPQTI